MEKILITIKPEQNFIIEEYAKKLGGGANKSGIIRDALDFYFKLKLGLKYKALENEFKERNK